MCPPALHMLPLWKLWQNTGVDQMTKYISAPSPPFFSALLILHLLPRSDVLCFFVVFDVTNRGHCLKRVDASLETELPLPVLLTPHLPMKRWRLLPRKKGWLSFLLQRPICKCRRSLEQTLSSSWGLKMQTGPTHTLIAFKKIKIRAIMCPSRTCKDRKSFRTKLQIFIHFVHSHCYIEANMSVFWISDFSVGDRGLTVLSHQHQWMNLLLMLTTFNIEIVLCAVDQWSPTLSGHQQV